jgi:biopolymer transport protein ExbD
MPSIRRRFRPRQDSSHDAVGLNIYPMMDMMTILLVFMIMQLSAVQADVIPTAELQIPWSTMRVEPAEAIAVQVSRHAISVDGHEVLRLRDDATVDPGDKRGGGHGFLITDLEQAIRRHRERAELIALHNPQRPFRGEVRIIADRRTPYRTLSEVIYTLGQSRYDSLHFIVLQQGQGG